MGSMDDAFTGEGTALLDLDHAGDLPAPRRAVLTGRNRIVAAAAGFVLLFGALSLRLVDLALSVPDDLSFMQSAREADLPRADIVDRNGMLMATDVSVWAAYADPSRIWDPAAAARRLRTVLPHLDEGALAASLAGEGRFRWIERELTPQEQYEIHNLGIPGIGFLPERERFYPHGETIAHVLGHVDIDGSGIAGVEMALDHAVAGRARSGQPVALSIDMRAQHALFDELGAAMKTFSAQAAAGVVIHVHTGEVIALASLPSYDPNAAQDAAGSAKFNRATAGVYELGSILKAFTLASALDSGAVTLEDGYDATHPIRMGRFRINDFHPEKRYLTVPEIFLHSSNIGTAKMAADMGTPVQQAYLERFGLLARPDIELPERGRPIVPERWGELETMTISYGHGIAVSPLQVAVAATALVNGGCLTRPTVLRVTNRGERPCARVISQGTSRIMRQLMRDAVVNGTGKKADVPGFPVAGKTGTAEKAKRGGYHRRQIITSFLGTFPAQDPEYVVLVMLDEPRGTKATHGFATAGWTAAPLASKVVARMAPLLGIVPVIPKEETTDAPLVALREMGAGDLHLASYPARGPGVSGIGDDTDIVSSRLSR